jgi:hypothetical protein
MKIGLDVKRNFLSVDERRKKVLELNQQDKPQAFIAKELHISTLTIQSDFKYLKVQGHEIREYKREGVSDKWLNIIKRTKEELSWFTKLGIKASLRAMFYRLYSLGLLSNTEGEYNELSKKSAAARRGREKINTKYDKKGNVIKKLIGEIGLVKSFQ